MFEFGQIPLFPFESTSITVTTTVWIGVMIAVFFNLRFGWTLSALVIPGYVVPLLITRPITAVVILVEAILTYAIAIWLSEFNRKHPYWSSVFGRDRFFLIVVISVLVRSICDGWLLPVAGRWFIEEFNINFDYRNELCSFGLIAVALIANYFWKPGLKFGIPCLLTLIGLTWVAVVWILVPFTNFNMGSFELLYEDISASMLASPKAYIVILITGWFASWVNLRYAWDFNGILIPALLALLWPHPDQVLVSFIEAALVLMTGKMLVASSLFRNIAVQGARKLAVFFTLCFAFRFITAHFLSVFAPELRITDFFGTGYLLSTLIAIKIFDKKVPIRMTKGILQVSMVGVVMASLIGFSIDRLGVAREQNFQPQVPQFYSTTIVNSERTIEQLFKQEKLRHYRVTSRRETDRASSEQLARFDEAMHLLAEICKSNQRLNSLSETSEIAKLLADASYEIVVTGNHEIVVREAEPSRGRGWFALSTKGSKRLNVIAPHCISERWSGESAIRIFRELDAKSIGILGKAKSENSVISRLANQDYLRAFQNHFADHGSLLVRSTPPKLSFDSQAPTNDILEFEGSLLHDLDLPTLEGITRGLVVKWKSESQFALVKSTSTILKAKSPVAKSADASVFLSYETRRKLAAAPLENPQHRRTSEPNENDSLAAIESLKRVFQQIKDDVLPPGSEGYVAPKTEEILFLDEAIIRPILNLVRKKPTRSTVEELQAISHDARSLDYQLRLIRESDTRKHYLVLSECSDSETRRGWGTVVFEWGLKDPRIVEIPRPNYEFRSFEFGANIFQRPGASVLFVAGAHPFANKDGSSDLTKSANRQNMINVIRHVLFREFGSQPWIAVQTRSTIAELESDVLITSHDGVQDSNSLSTMQRQIYDSFIDAGMSVEFVDGRPETAGYELSSVLRASANQISDNKEIMSVWLSPHSRSAFRQQDPNDNLNSELLACGLNSTFDSRQQLVRASKSNRDTVSRIPISLRHDLIEFAKNQNVIQLYSLIQDHGDYQFDRYFDLQTKTTLIVIRDQYDKVISLVNPRGNSERPVEIRQLTDMNFEEFIVSRSIILEVK